MHSPTQDDILKERVSIFEDFEHQLPAVRESGNDLAVPIENIDTMDNVLASIKWIFLFLPGATAIHISMLIMSFSIAQGIWPSEIIFQLVGSLIIFSFLVLFGLGRLTDFRYLKVVGVIISSGILSSVVTHILTSFFIGYDNFGWCMLGTLPFTLWLAHKMKQRIDAEPSEAGAG